MVIIYVLSFLSHIHGNSDAQDAVLLYKPRSSPEINVIASS